MQHSKLFTSIAACVLSLASATATADGVYDIKKYINPNVDSSNLAGRWMMVRKATNQDTGVVVESRETVIIGTGDVYFPEITFDTCASIMNEGNSVDVGTLGSSLDVTLGGALGTLQLNVVSNTRMSGRWYADFPLPGSVGSQFPAASRVELVKIQDDVLDEGGTPQQQLESLSLGLMDLRFEAENGMITLPGQEAICFSEASYSNADTGESGHALSTTGAYMSGEDEPEVFVGSTVRIEELVSDNVKTVQAAVKVISSNPALERDLDSTGFPITATSTLRSNERSASGRIDVTSPLRASAAVRVRLP